MLEVEGDEEQAGGEEMMESLIEMGGCKRGPPLALHPSA